MYLWVILYSNYWPWSQTGRKDNITPTQELLTDDRVTSHGSGRNFTTPELPVYIKVKNNNQYSYRREKYFVWDLKQRRHPFCLLWGIKRVGGPCCKIISYPFLSLTHPATLTFCLYLFPKTQTCTLVQLPSSFLSSFSLSPSSPLRLHSAVAVLHPRALAILKASSAVLPLKLYVFRQPARYETD